MMRATVLALVAALALAASAAAAPRPDAHDRALVKELGEKVTAFQAVSAKTNSNSNALKNCSVFRKNPSQAFAAAFVLLPALLVDVVNHYKPQLTDLRDTLAGMHPDSSLFREWVAAETQSFDLILQFDNHGKAIDYCKAAQVLLSNKSTAADVRAVLGINPSLVAKLFQGGSHGPSATLARLNPQIRKFFVAGGLTVKQAAALTT